MKPRYCTVFFIVLVLLTGIHPLVSPGETAKAWSTPHSAVASASAFFLDPSNKRYVF